MDKKEFDELRLSRAELNLRASESLQQEVEQELAKSKACCKEDETLCCKQIKSEIVKASQNENNKLNIKRQ